MTSDAFSGGTTNTPDRAGVKRICIATSIHPDFDARVFRHAKAVADNGYEVDLVCPWVHGDRPLPPRLRLVTFKRVASRRLRPLLVPLRIVRLLLARRYDLYHFHDLDLLWIMGLLGLLLRRPVIYDCHENYAAEVRHKTYLPAWARPAMAFAVLWYERFWAAVVRNVVLVVPSQRRTFASSWYKAILVRNFAELALERGRVGDLLDRPPACITIASQYVNNGALMVLDVARAVGRVLPNVKFYVVDRYGSDLALRNRVLSEIETPELRGRVKMLPNVLPPDIMKNLNQASVGMTLGLPSPTLEAGLPTKLFEYMAAGLPVVAADFPTSREVVEESRCGLLVRPGDVEGFAAAIVQLVENPGEAAAMGERGLAAFRAKYNWEAEVEGLLNFYKNLLGTAVPGRE